MQRSADLDDLDLLEVGDAEMVNQEKEDDEDGLAPASYYVPQNRSLSRLSKMDAYRVITEPLFFYQFCAQKMAFLSLPPNSHICRYL